MASIGPALPPGFTRQTRNDSDDDAGPNKVSIGPARPPTAATEVATNVVGPTLPPVVGPTLPPNVVGPARPPPQPSSVIGPARPDPNDLLKASEYHPPEPEFVDVGPMPLPASGEQEDDASELAHKIAMIERRSIAHKKNLNDTANPVENRQQWMTELPELYRKDTLCGTEARTFRKRAATVDKNASVWTDTPADREKKKQKKLQQGEASTSVVELDPAQIASLERDRKIDEHLKKHNDKHRSKSLVELHIKKKEKKEKKRQKKEKKEKDKERKKGKKVVSSRPERVAWDREKDLDMTRSKSFGKKESREANSALKNMFASSSDRKYL